MSPEPKELSTLDEESLSRLQNLAKTNFYFFAKAVCGFKDLTLGVHKPLCEQLQQLKDGECIRVLLPRGWFKTTVVSIAYSLWRAVNNPNIRILLVQNTATNAEAKLRSIRGIVEGSQLFRTLFADLLPGRNEIWTKNSLCLSRTNKQNVESTFESAGINTQVVSRHYDIIIEDDTVAPDLNEIGEEALAPTKENIGQAIGWHKLATPLLVNPQESNQIVVGTRWFEKDLLSWIEEKEPQYKSYVRSCRETNGVSDPQGKITFPERFSETTLSRLEKALGPYMFSCLYLNLPMSSADMIFKHEWFQYYETEPKGLDIYITVDAAGDPSEQKSKDSDYNVVLTTGKHPKTGRIYVLDYWRARANPGEVIEEVFRQVSIWKPIKVGVEHVAYQSTLSYWLKEKMRDTDTYFLVEPIRHGNKSKNFRIQGLQPIFAAGSIYLRQHHRVIETELLAFPLGSHDDVIDALAMHQFFWTVTDSVQKTKAEDPAQNALTLDNLIGELMRRGKENDNILSDVAKSQSAMYALNLN